MKLDELQGLIEQRWRGEFLRFVETGGADPAFLEYLDHDPSAQRAVEMAFDAQAQAFEELSQELAKSKDKTAKQPNVSSATAVSMNIVRAVVAALGLPDAERTVAISQAAAALEASMTPDSKHELESVITRLEKNFKKVAVSG
jgi:hypothetical protein